MSSERENQSQSWKVPEEAENGPQKCWINNILTDIFCMQFNHRDDPVFRTSEKNRT